MANPNHFENFQQILIMTPKKKTTTQDEDNGKRLQNSSGIWSGKAVAFQLRYFNGKHCESQMFGRGNCEIFCQSFGNAARVCSACVNEETVERLVVQYPHIVFSTVMQDCKRTLERAYQMGWSPNTSNAL
ncbi:unnamed protein product [Boreogadus saida]